jgi:hypothetical protein
LVAEQRRQEVLRQAWQGHMKALLLDLCAGLGAVSLTAADGGLLLPLNLKMRRKDTATSSTLPVINNVSCGTARCVTTTTTGSSRSRSRSSHAGDTSRLQPDPAAQAAVLQRLMGFLSGRGHWCLYGWLLSTSVRTGAVNASLLAPS